MRWCTGRPHLALVLLGLGVLALQAQSSQGGAGLPELTPWGASVRRVVFAVLNSGFCKSRNGDWRGDLPRHLVRFLPQAKARPRSGLGRSHPYQSTYPAHSGPLLTRQRRSGALHASGQWTFFALC